MRAEAIGIYNQGQVEYEQPQVARGLGEGWIQADHVPQLRAVRLQADLETAELYRQRAAAPEAQKPPAIDPLTAARRVLEADAAFGPGSPERAEAWEGLLWNCRRELAEGARRNQPGEYFPPLVQEYDASKEAYTFKGFSLLEMVDNGITPHVVMAEDRAIRGHERKEEITLTAIRALGSLTVGKVVHLRPAEPVENGPIQAEAVPEVTCITIRECPQWAIDAYKADPDVIKKQNGLGGLVPEHETLMVQGVSFSRTEDVRAQESVSLSGKVITHEVTLETLYRMELLDRSCVPSRSELAGMQFINVNGQGVLAFTEMLDVVAEELSGKQVFMGNYVSEEHPKNYANVPAESEARQAQFEEGAHTLAAEMLKWCQDEKLEVGNVIQRYNKFVQRVVLKATCHDPIAVSKVFNYKTALGVVDVNLKFEQGDIKGALQLFEQVLAEAPVIPGCQAGSCGLEAVSTLSADGQKAQSLGLRAGSGELLRSTDLRCPDCKKPKIHYDAKNKVCVGCGLTSINGVIKKKSLTDTKSTDQTIFLAALTGLGRQSRSQGSEGSRQTELARAA